MENLKKVCLSSILALTFPNCLLAQAPSWVQSIPVGEWKAISLNTIEDASTEKEFGTSLGGTSNIIEAWNGGAFASKHGKFGSLLVYGGGHGSYNGSDVYAFDLDTQKWTRASEAYLGSLDGDYPVGEFPDGSAVPPHTYDGVEYHPATNSFVVLRSIKNLTEGTNAANLHIVHMLDLNTGKWRRSQRDDNSARMHGASSCYDRNRDVFWMQGAYNTAFSQFDPKPANGDGTFGARTNYVNSNLEIDSAAACDPINDLYVMTVFRLNDRVLAKSLSEPNKKLVQLQTTGSQPATSKNGFEYSKKRNSFLYWGRQTGVYELKHDSGDPLTGTWKWSLIANSTMPQPMRNDSSNIYSRFRIANFGTEEVALIVNRVDGPVYAFRVPEGGEVLPGDNVAPAEPTDLDAQ